jgi:protocatechuate 3,4-dioxygenase beta subunit
MDSVRAKWVWRVLVVLLLAGGAAYGLLCSSGIPSGPLPGGDAPARISLTKAGEPGQPMVVEGRVFQPDGKTPAPGVVLYVYQTDLSGHYNTQPGRPPRLRGWMKTDAQGRYEYRSIRPAPYPGRSIAAHVHTQLWGGGWPAQWNEDLLLADDAFLKETERLRSAAAGTFAFVCTPRLVAGVAHCTHNLRLKPKGDTFEENTRHGFRRD